MKIFLAGGMTVMNVKGRERELSQKMPVWRRLFSYHFMNTIENSKILEIKADDQK